MTADGASRGYHRGRDTLGRTKQHGLIRVAQRLIIKPTRADLPMHN